jgi:sn-glycerol 3-phosphate transport system permease protein
MAMVDRRIGPKVFRHAVMILGLLLVFFPIYISFVASTHSLRALTGSRIIPILPGGLGLENYATALLQGSQSTTGSSTVAALQMLRNSFIMAVGITLGKIVFSLMGAYALVYFKFPGKNFFFWLIFITLMLPVEVRILPTYKVIADLNLLNSYAGLILPAIVSATATFLFRQFFMSVPNELAEAAKLDGAGPMAFFRLVLIPVTQTAIAAMVVIQFIYGWNQYLWPLLITTEPQYQTILIGIRRMLAVGDAQAEWQIIMATTIIAMTPPVLIIIFMQKQFVAGMTEMDK